MGRGLPLLLLSLLTMTFCGLAEQFDTSTLWADALFLSEVKDIRARDVKFGCVNTGAEAEWVGPQGRMVPETRFTDGAPLPTTAHSRGSVNSTSWPRR
ncbi:hypothetical protein CCHR01_05467 [Colletotrichum chrysophilum]|uniref:Uncharacterized protein n=1 Tax=Colletotrichum chrysophilum TaxID=1836956 RepID=A0AAD9ARL0_9PEZI|nr:hypothetical protein CCHR01_05467 [Colletotrichum chrysophilum]